MKYSSLQSCVAICKLSVQQLKLLLGMAFWHTGMIEGQQWHFIEWENRFEEGISHCMKMKKWVAVSTWETARVGSPVNRRFSAVLDACSFTIKFPHFLVKNQEKINAP